jgi:FkbM family methyltransferase
MIRRLYRAIFPPKPSEENLLIAEAEKVPRYTPHQFSYRNYKIGVSDFLSVAYQVKEYFVDERMKFTSSNPEPLILDCGANVGVSILYFKSLFPKSRIEAFEPDPKIIQNLKNNISANNISGVTVHQKAVWKNNDGISFGVEGADGGSVFLENKNTIKVETIRLKDLLAKQTRVDVLKIDIEGAETEVIKDCNEELKKVKYLFVEYHSFTSKKQELNELLSVLTNNGFRYYIHSIGGQTQQPFMKVDAYNGMDVQLDIYAVNNSIN